MTYNVVSEEAKLQELLRSLITDEDIINQLDVATEIDGEDNRMKFWLSETKDMHYLILDEVREDEPVLKFNGFYIEHGFIYFNL